MTNKLFILLLLTFFYPLVHKGQNHLKNISFKEKVNDSLFFESQGNTFYNFFYQKTDSIIDPFTLNPIPVVKKIIIDSLNKNGFLYYIVNGNILYKFFVVNFKINGLGLHYNSLLNNNKTIAFEQGYFENGFLDGHYYHLNYNDNGVIIANLFYKKGKLNKVYKATDYYGDMKKWKKFHVYPGCEQ
jgi:hypothetical protein